jgi:hypothetical protein
MLNIKHLGKLLMQPEYRKYELALQNLKNTPRYTLTSTDILGTEIELVDAASFLSTTEAEPFVKECCRVLRPQGS